MPTLSFSCPKCNKLHERIKPEMVGHKVRCQCGFVFRLGSKSDKQEWFSEELKRNKARKNKKPVKSHSVKQEPREKLDSLFDLQPKIDFQDPFGPDTASPSNDIIDVGPVNSNNEPVNDLIPVAPLNPELNEEILDGIPVPVPSDHAGYRPDPFPAEDGSAIPVGVVVDSDPFSTAVQTQQLSVSAPRQPSRVSSQRPKNGKRGTPLKSSGGPVWSLILTLLGTPVVIVLMVFSASYAIAAYRLSTSGVAFGQVASQFQNSGLMTSGVTVQIVFNVSLFIVYGVLMIAMIATAVVAIMELSKRVYIGWASKTSAIIASVVLVVLLLMFCAHVFILFQAMGEFDKSVIGIAVLWLAFRYCLWGFVPLVVMITGFARVAKRSKR